MWSQQDIKFMRRALRLGKKGLGYTTPNPAVGAVVVSNGEVVGEGYHQKAGTPHAEIHALRAAGDRARGADLYVTLEPCNHTGRTPPCTHAILKAGIRKVVIGTTDPNPKVTGGGAGFLRDHGLEVKEGLLREECRSLIVPFVKHILTGIPWVRSKVACSLDGRTATHTGHSKWITNQQARRSGHCLREMSDAILVGKGTILADDPRLTCRKSGARRDPVRIVLDSKLGIDPSCHICHLDSPAPTIIVGVEGRAEEEKKKALEATGAEVWLMPPDNMGKVDISILLRELGNYGIQSILVEGGATVHGTFLDQGYVDEVFFYFAPLVIGGVDSRPAIAGIGAAELGTATRLSQVRYHKLGDNWMIHGMATDVNSFWG